MITLSRMTRRDLPLFNTVRNASREFLTDKAAYTLPETAAWFAGGGGSQYLVVLLELVPIGYCRVTDGEGGREKFVGMDLHPHYRGRGLARPAYAALFARLGASGVRRFRLRVLKDNARARHLYDALGFVFVADHGDEIEMVRTEGQDAA